MKHIENLIRENLVFLDMEASSKEDAFRKIACRIAECECVERDASADLCERLTQREEIGTTAVGGGIAIPHAYYENLSEPMIAFARLIRPIDFEADDKMPVDKIFFLVGRKRNDTEHLMILARLARLLKDEKFRNQLDSLSSGAELMEAINEVESRH